MNWYKEIIEAIEKEIMMIILVRLFFNLLRRLRDKWSYLTRWAEEHYDLIEIESVALNGPPDGWTYPKRVMRVSH